MSSQFIALCPLCYGSGYLQSTAMTAQSCPRCSLVPSVRFAQNSEAPPPENSGVGLSERGTGRLLERLPPRLCL